jgi:hypothetical protein
MCRAFLTLARSGQHAADTTTALYGDRRRAASIFEG